MPSALDFNVTRAPFSYMESAGYAEESGGLRGLGTVSIHELSSEALVMVCSRMGD